ncbi:FAD binding domain-containing protein [Cantharellus anzutake]|uniref:FAD binding domain-containing protein n=1 Tax=Cantharellus anzutake TaxID=1750568 RepID=UPI0019055D3A|nr:FAD binding domain-containing protein [Cantharellus anzutake]KAF8333044.1 FAD binding domain-containing protein [Cantharellus anzutake]
MASPSSRKPAVEQEQFHTLVNHREFPAPLSAIERDEYDVVIIGAGPAGLFLSSALARLGGHKVLTIDQRIQPTEAGRADGIQPRTVEVLKNMQPLGDDLFSRSSASFERSFWNPTKDGRGIERSRRVQSFPTHLEIEDNCTLGLQQGLIEQGFLRDMEAHGAHATRPWTFKSFKIVESDSDYPVHITLQHAKEQFDRSVRAKYMVGCDGGRSSVRHFLQVHHGFKFDGEWVDTLWGAIDAVVKSDFPDLRKIATIHSKNNGAMYIFPRENSASGKPIVRLYTQVNVVDGVKDKSLAHAARDSVTMKTIIDADKKIIAPYKLEFEEVEWWTAYPIGQRLVSSYSHKNRIFLAGGTVGTRFLGCYACHTHSPKAGQGMNTALMDAHNLSYKLHHVLSGLAKPNLLSTYHTERWKIGKQLIDFDAEYAAIFSGEIPKNRPELAKLSAEELADYFLHVQRRNADFTSGVGVVYADDPLTVSNAKLSKFGLELIKDLKLRAGERLLSAFVTRVSNLQPVRLIHEIQFDAPGAFRLYVFGGAFDSCKRRLRAFSTYLLKPNSFVQRFKPALPKGAKRVLPAAMNTGVTGYEELNPWFNILTIIRNSRFRFNLEDFKDFPGLNSMLYADDEEQGGDKIGDADGDATVGGVHRKYGLDNDGGIVICRPDGYVGIVVPITQAGFIAIDKYFGSILLPTTHETQPKPRL